MPSTEITFYFIILRTNDIRPGFLYPSALINPFNQIITSYNPEGAVGPINLTLLL